jgi:hypothetical protein
MFSLYIRMREAEIYCYQSSLTPIRTVGLVIVRDQDKSFFMRLLNIFFSCTIVMNFHSVTSGIQLNFAFTFFPV